MAKGQVSSTLWVLWCFVSSPFSNVCNSDSGDNSRVFGEVPQSVKESLAAKEALREATAGGFGKDMGKKDKSEKDTAETMKVSYTCAYIRL